MAIDPDNLAHWNDVTIGHVVSPFYRTEDFRRGGNVLDPIVREAVGDVAGKRLLHLQCHFGLDTLSLARMGADVTGLDFSPVAIAHARALAEEAGIAAQFVESDVLDPPAHLREFDVVFASWGAIWWIADIGAWMKVAANALRRDGRLFLCEGHPILTMLDERGTPEIPFLLRYPYDSDTPHVDDSGHDYAGANVAATRTRGYFHGLARILSAAIDAGLAIRGFKEGDRVPWRPMEAMVKIDRDYWALPPGAPSFPLNFQLHAVKT